MWPYLVLTGNMLFLLEETICRPLIQQDRDISPWMKLEEEKKKKKAALMADPQKKQKQKVHRDPQKKKKVISSCKVLLVGSMKYLMANVAIKCYVIGK